MSRIQTYTRTTTAVLDYKFDLAPRTNGRINPMTNQIYESDWLQSGETIDSYTITSSDADLVINSSEKTDSDTSITYWLSGGDITDTVYYIDIHVVTSDGREDDFSVRFIPVQRK